MSRLLTTIVVLSLTGGAVALAQNSSLNSNSKARTTTGQAPVGHRQPTRADVPMESNDKGLFDPDAENKALNRKLKSICRGC